MRRIVPTLVIGMVMSSGLAACGGANTEELQREAVGCSTYFTVLNDQILSGDPAFADRVMAALVDPAATDADAQLETINRTLVDMAGGTDARRRHRPRKRTIGPRPPPRRRRPLDRGSRAHFNLRRNLGTPEPVGPASVVA